MKQQYRIVSLLLALLAILSLVSCQGEYRPAVGGGTKEPEDTEDTGEYIPPEMNDDPSDDFVVKLLADGAEYSPRMDIYVYWNDGFSVHKAKVDEKGEARVDGLDGDYRVTLSALPNEYTYDPNGYLATNVNRQITIDMRTLNRLSGAGTDLYSCYTFRKAGVYSVKFNAPGEVFYFQYEPDGMGTYSIESWVDVTEDNVNPYVKVYGGHSEYKYYIQDINDGGAVGSYTQNFVHTVQIAAENFGATGQAVYTFALMADVKNNKYPVTVTFAVKRNGDFEIHYPNEIREVAIPKFDLSSVNVRDHEYDLSTHVFSYCQSRSEDGSYYIIDDNTVKLWKKSEGGDDFYHLYDKTLYPDTNGYGPILYTAIKAPNRIIQNSVFTELHQPMGGSRVSAGGSDYRHFIEGYTALATNQKRGEDYVGSYYCAANCPCHRMPDDQGKWACPKSCTKCLSTCSRCPDELMYNEGYQSIANSLGYVPVTEELHDFLVAYATANKTALFNDGVGAMETSGFGGRIFRAVGESAWLFACGYFKER